MDPATELRKRVERYLKKTGQTKTAFGKAVNNNPALVPRIRREKVGLITIRAVTKYLDKMEAS